MNVDTQFQPAPFAGTPHRPAQRPVEQESMRPVDRPHHSEAAGKQANNESEQVAERKPADQQAPADRTPGQASELSPDEKREVEQPSSQDFAVAAKAGQLEAEARAELSKQEDNESSATDTAPARGGFDTNPTQPASVGELLDVVA